MGRFCLALLVLAGLTAGFAGDASAQVTYGLGPGSDLLDGSFYASGSRTAWWGTLNNGGTTVAFFGVDYPSFNTEIYLVELGDPSSWRQLTNGFPQIPRVMISWTPDDSRLFVDVGWIDLDTGEITPGGAMMGVPVGGHSVHFTSKASGNWLLANSIVPTQSVLNIVAVPILPDGTEDPSRSPVAITDFHSMALRGIVRAPVFTADGSLVAFWDHGQPGGGMPDIGDVYSILDVGAIISAAKHPGTLVSSLAPTDLMDPRIVPIRAGVTPDNFASGPAFSQDNSLILFNEDWNNVFRNADFFGTIASAEFDIMIRRSDGGGGVFRVEVPGNQGIPNPTRGGTRMLFIDSVAAGAMPGFQNINFHLFMSTLEVSTSVNSVAQPLPETTTEVVIGGEAVTLPASIVLTDSAVQLDAPVIASDASGTKVMLIEDQVINFPAGTMDMSITITTPIDPVTSAQLPPNASVDAIPVVREFGPAGTQFLPPIAITISYTDAEIAGLDETTLGLYLFNPMSGMFDTMVPESDILHRDLANNSITFQVSHFSVYGLGGAGPIQMPWAPMVGLIGACVLAGLVGAWRVMRNPR